VALKKFAGSGCGIGSGDPFGSGTERLDLFLERGFEDADKDALFVFGGRFQGKASDGLGLLRVEHPTVAGGTRRKEAFDVRSHGREVGGRAGFVDMAGLVVMGDRRTPECGNAFGKQSRQERTSVLTDGMLHGESFDLHLNNREFERCEGSVD
jgi:hypothetical protein